VVLGIEILEEPRFKGSLRSLRPRRWSHSVRKEWLGGGFIPFLFPNFRKEHLGKGLKTSLLLNIKV